MPTNRNLNRRIRQALYSLKRQFGASIDIYKLVSTDTDVRTGNKTIDKTVYQVARAIVLPETMKRAAKQVSALAATSKDVMSPGAGTYNSGTRVFIIDRLDVPDLPDLGQDDWIVYDSDKYQIAEVESFEVNAGWVITAKRIVGEIPEQIKFGVANQTLSLVSQASATVG
jgi:hypothetical protein